MSDLKHADVKAAAQRGQINMETMAKALEGDARSMAWTQWLLDGGKGPQSPPEGWQEPVTAETLTDEQIRAERQQLDRDITTLQVKHGSKAVPLVAPLQVLRHDCWVAVGLHASRVRGGKLEAKARIAAAINARREGSK